MLQKFLISLLLVITLQAQEQKMASIRFASIQELNKPTLHLVFGAKNTPVTISSRNLSAPIKIPAGVSIHLCNSLPAELTPAEISKTSLASFTLKPTSTDAIALLLPDKNNKLKITLIDTQKFPWGSRLINNLSKKSISISYAKTKLNLRPRKSGILKSTGANAGEFTPVIGLYLGKDKPRRFISSRWVHDPKSRSIIFVYDKNDNGAPSFHGIEDTKIPESDEKAP